MAQLHKRARNITRSDRQRPCTLQNVSSAAMTDSAIGCAALQTKDQDNETLVRKLRERFERCGAVSYTLPACAIRAYQPKVNFHRTPASLRHVPSEY